MKSFRLKTLLGATPKVTSAKALMGLFSALQRVRIFRVRIDDFAVRTIVEDTNIADSVRDFVTPGEILDRSFLNN